jgi:hypothetical protein
MTYLVLMLFLQSTPPTFGPDNPEGLKLSPNASIRHSFLRKVFWKANYNNPGSVGKPPLSAAERQAMGQMLDALVGIQKATPNGSQGIGYWMLESRTLGFFNFVDPPVDFPAARVPAEYWTGLFPFYHEDIRQANGVWRQSVAGETESVYYYFNQHPGKMEAEVIAKESRGLDKSDLEYYLKPEVTATLHGMPLYFGQVLVVARAGRELWSPAPLGAVLKAGFTLYEQDKKTAEDRLAGLKKKNEEIQSPNYEKEAWAYFEKNNNPATMQRPQNYATRKASTAREIQYNREKAAAEANPKQDKDGAWYWNPISAYNNMVARFAALTPEEMAKPACFLPAVEKGGRYQMRGDILPLGGDSRCIPIVTTNWNYFDPKLPRTSPQILTVRNLGRCAKVVNNQVVGKQQPTYRHPPQGCIQHAQIWMELDWNQVKGLVVP